MKITFFEHVQFLNVSFLGCVVIHAVNILSGPRHPLSMGFPDPLKALPVKDQQLEVFFKR